MIRTRTTPFAVTVLGAVALLALVAPSAAAQAFVPAQGEGSVSILFQDQFYKYHVIPTKESQGLIYSDSLLVDVSFGLTDKIAVGIGLPWVATRYAGSSPHLLPDLSGPNPVDDGNWHSTAAGFSRRLPLQPHEESPERRNRRDALRRLGDAEPRLHLLRACRLRPRSERGADRSVRRKAVRERRSRTDHPGTICVRVRSTGRGHLAQSKPDVARGRRTSSPRSCG